MRILSLNGLRTVFAVMIFLVHSPLNDSHAIDFGGSLAVCFFMVLSGFVISMGYGSKVLARDFSYRDYISRRIIKILPLHLLLLCAYMAIYLYQGFGSINLYVKFVINALLLQGYFPIKGIYGSFNAASWFLCALMFFYAIFPFIYRHITDHRKRIPLYIIVLTILCTLLNVFTPEPYCADIVYINPLVRLADFILGMILYQIFLKLRENTQLPSPLACSIAECATLVLLSFAVVLSIYLGEKYQLAVIWWIPLSLLILTFTLFDSGRGCLGALLRSRFFAELGNISFTIYMIHGFFIRFILPSLHVPFGDDSIYMRTAILFIMILCASFLIHKYYENYFALIYKAKREK